VSSESGPIRVFAKKGMWLVDYGSYAHGYHATREEAIATGTKAARDEHRELVIDEPAVEEEPINRANPLTD
jgi:hypothetical protein